ncbi:hypothetical protein LCGC14_2879950, partial [marine sediment metagenome]
TIPSSLAGTWSNLTKTLNLPIAPPGNFTSTDDVYIGMIVDANNDVAESNESNNSNVGLSYDKDLVHVVLPPTQADLYDDGDAMSYFNPDIVDSPGTPGYGQPWDAYFDIRNGGPAASGSFYVDFYASSNATITPIDHLLGRVTMSSIAGGSYGNADLNLTTFPAGIPAGVYYVGIIIDPTNVVAESNESNNIGVDINGYSLTVTGYRDLYDDGDSWNGFSPTTVQTGQTWSARMDVRNEGTADAAGFWVTFYASTDNIINTGDYFIDDVWVSGVTAGNYVDVDLSSILFPFNIPVGDYYVGTIIDASNSVNESDESNNNHAFDEYPLRVAILGDANNDGVVSADDYGSVQINFGDTGDVGILGDANLDGVVSSDDYGSVQLNFGNTSWMG